MADTQRPEALREEMLLSFVADLQQYNRIAREVESVGMYYRSHEEMSAQPRLPPGFAGLEVREDENVPYAPRDLIQTINGSTKYLDIGIVNGDTRNGERATKFVPKGNHGSRTIRLESGLLEPFAYPLLHPHGESGWSTKCKPEVQLSQYICTTILQRENITMPSIIDPSVRLQVNRRQAMPRLGQTNVLDNVSRMIDLNLNFVRGNQDRIRGGDYDNMPGLVEETDDNDPHNNHDDPDHSAPIRNTLCPSSVTGSKRHLAGRAKEALAVAAHYGGITEFLTLTVNKDWREIKEQLPVGQTAFDRPDITVQVFQEKLRALIANLKAGKYHGGSWVYVDKWDTVTETWVEDTVGTYVAHSDSDECILDYLMVVIEYQHRGLPHAHLVYRIRYAPEGPRRGDTPEQVSIDYYSFILCPS